MPRHQSVSFQGSCPFSLCPSSEAILRLFPLCVHSVRDNIHGLLSLLIPSSLPFIYPASIPCDITTQHPALFARPPGSQHLLWKSLFSIPHHPPLLERDTETFCLYLPCTGGLCPLRNKGRLASQTLNTVPVIHHCHLPVPPGGHVPPWWLTTAVAAQIVFCPQVPSLSSIIALSISCHHLGR